MDLYNEIVFNLDLHMSVEQFFFCNHIYIRKGTYFNSCYQLFCYVEYDKILFFY